MYCMYVCVCACLPACLPLPMLPAGWLRIFDIFAYSLSSTSSLFRESCISKSTCLFSVFSFTSRFSCDEFSSLPCKSVESLSRHIFPFVSPPDRCGLTAMCFLEYNVSSPPSVSNKIFRVFYNSWNLPIFFSKLKSINPFPS